MSGALSGFTVTVYEEERGGNARYIATVFRIERAGGLTSAQSSGVVGGARWWLAEGALVSELEGVAEAGAVEAHLRGCSRRHRRWARPIREDITHVS